MLQSSSRNLGADRWQKPEAIDRGDEDESASTGDERPERNTASPYQVARSDPAGK
jgi:hypothetical protein